MLIALVMNIYQHERVISSNSNKRLKAERKAADKIEDVRQTPSFDVMCLKRHQGLHPLMPHFLPV
jgi:hypothetical protein